MNTKLGTANAMLREAKYAEARLLYEEVKGGDPAMAGMVAANLAYADWKQAQTFKAVARPQGLDLATFVKIMQAGLFDQTWYCTMYAAELDAALAPLEHYLQTGTQRGFDPSPNFNTKYYLATNLDVEKAGMNPLLHYVRYGIAENRKPLPVSLAHVSQQQLAVDRQYVTPMPRKVDSGIYAGLPKVVAFYLPQFHRIPENDRWWGKGFTEWTNVRSAKKQFSDHYQPREPAELGYYNLDGVATLKKQIALAQDYGVGAFCFYYYWFGGKRLLEKPVANFLKDKSLNMPFCLCWANENWTRRWDGKDTEVLMGQNYSPADDIAFIKGLAPYLKDKRYLKVNGKPLVVVYRPNLFPDIKATAGRWRAWCRENTLGEICLAMTHAFEKTNPHSIGFDFAIEFPPTGHPPNRITDVIEGMAEDFDGVVYDWNSMKQSSLERAAKQSPDWLFHGVCPSWDNTARRKKAGSILYGSEPRKYQDWLAQIMVQTAARNSQKDKLVFVNAWNEWAEGAYLEPDARYGYAALDATRTALLRAAQLCGAADGYFTNDMLAIVVHSFYPEILHEILDEIQQANYTNFHLYLTCPANLKRQNAAVLKQYPFASSIHVVENRGRDVLPFFTVLETVLQARHRCILKLHTKKSAHRGDGAVWRQDMFGKLLAGKLLKGAVKKFATAPKLGMIAPAGHMVPMDQYWGSNEQHILPLASRLGLSNEEAVSLVFAAGNMFYIRSCALLPLVQMVDPDKFEPEQGQTDGTYAHALERIFAVLLHSLKLEITDTRGNNSVVRNYSHA